LSNILFSYEVILSLFITISLFIVLGVAFFNTIYILKYYKKNRTSTLQYKLEKHSYLIVTIIYISLMIKVLFLPYFIFTIDKLSNIISGAMCGAGVIGANIYGEPLIILKLVIILVTMLWLRLHRYDLIVKGFIYFKKKMWLFIFIFILLVIELILEYLFFTNLSIQNPVSCCSTLYKSTQNSNQLPFNLSIFQLVIGFYLSYILLLISSYFQKRYIVTFLSFVYIYMSYFSIVYFFSSYIYQLPSHKCPYCLLQSDYYFIGYGIYGSIIMATYYALNSFFFYQMDKKLFFKIAIWYSISVAFISYNFILYLAINKTFL